MSATFTKLSLWGKYTYSTQLEKKPIRTKAINSLRKPGTSNYQSKTGFLVQTMNRFSWDSSNRADWDVLIPIIQACSTEVIVKPCLFWILGLNLPVTVDMTNSSTCWISTFTGGLAWNPWIIFCTQMVVQTILLPLGNEQQPGQSMRITRDQLYHFYLAGMDIHDRTTILNMQSKDLIRTITFRAPQRLWNYAFFTVSPLWKIVCTIWRSQLFVKPSS